MYFEGDCWQGELKYTHFLATVFCTPRLELTYTSLSICSSVYPTYKLTGYSTDVDIDFLRKTLQYCMYPWYSKVDCSFL